MPCTGRAATKVATTVARRIRKMHVRNALLTATLAVALAAPALATAQGPGGRYPGGPGAPGQGQRPGQGPGQGQRPGQDPGQGQAPGQAPMDPCANVDLGNVRMGPMNLPVLANARELDDNQIAEIDIGAAITAPECLPQNIEAAYVVDMDPEEVLGTMECALAETDWQLAGFAVEIDPESGVAHAMRYHLVQMGEQTEEGGPMQEVTLELQVDPQQGVTVIYATPQ
ncbi:hypothetical protein L6R50_14400 [Myxococcota bacterium]|nr:hypothetical protein [Myxococcota bacterium]